MYGKIYEQTFTGSMYGSGSHIFALWSYVIAHTKPDAMVELNPVALASTLGEDISHVEQAIEHFKSPDPKSRSKEFEGRRLIQKGEFIYFVPQYHKYHGFANDKERREYFAQKKREQRQRDKERQTVKSRESKNVTQSESYSDSDSETNKSATHSPALVPTADDIYAAYPLKKGKPEALKAIRLAMKRFGASFLLERTIAFAKCRNGDVEFVPYPQKWFKREDFNDDPELWKPKGSESEPESPSIFQQRDAKIQQLNILKRDMMREHGDAVYGMKEFEQIEKQLMSL